MIVQKCPFLPFHYLMQGCEEFLPSVDEKFIRPVLGHDQHFSPAYGGDNGDP